LFLAITAS